MQNLIIAVTLFNLFYLPDFNRNRWRSAQPQDQRPPPCVLDGSKFRPSPTD
jgi:hypothetical protein